MPHRALVAAALFFSLAASAEAHPSAMSSFDARTASDSLTLTFHIDATSCVDLLARLDPVRAAVDKDDLPAHAAEILVYLDERFSIAESGAACARAEGSSAAYDAG